MSQTASSDLHQPPEDRTHERETRRKRVTAVELHRPCHECENEYGLEHLNKKTGAGVVRCDKCDAVVKARQVL